MKYQTTIDTVTLQIDSISEDTRNKILQEILNLYKTENFHILCEDYPINKHSNFFVREYRVYANNIVIASISTGSFSVKNNITDFARTTYYISLKFAGLMRYNLILDKLYNDILFKTCAYFNSRNITYKLTGLDVCIDMHTKFENVLALCTKKSPKTLYWTSAEEQFYDTTHYIENIPKHKSNQAVQRAYLYDKRVKENLSFDLTRFEVKLQPKFFNKNRESIISSIIKALEKYHVMYVPKKKDKEYLMQQYDNYPALRQRDIKRIKFEDYRCYADISVIVGFMNNLFTIREEALM